MPTLRLDKRDEEQPDTMHKFTLSFSREEVQAMKKGQEVVPLHVSLPLVTVGHLVLKVEYQ